MTDKSWTSARIHSFIKGALRNASLRWPPRLNVKKNARLERGIYLCAGYKKKAHKVPASLPPPEGKKNRINNVLVDHIDPVINPETGFTSWDETIKRMFCGEDGLQILCHDCHSRKTSDEKRISNARME